VAPAAGRPPDAAFAFVEPTGADAPRRVTFEDPKLTRDPTASHLDFGLCDPTLTAPGARSGVSRGSSFWDRLSGSTLRQTFRASTGVRRPFALPRSASSRSRETTTRTRRRSSSGRRWLATAPRLTPAAD